MGLLCGFEKVTVFEFSVTRLRKMSVNKSQGQALKVAGLHLEEPCFSHGQFYVASSRVGDPNKLYILAQNGSTKNIVNKQALA